MQITEDMITPHHHVAAQRWIEKHGMPESDEEQVRMAREVVAEAGRVVQHMAEKTFQAIQAHRMDREYGVETIHGRQGRELLNDIYHELRQRA